MIHKYFTENNFNEIFSELGESKSSLKKSWAKYPRSFQVELEREMSSSPKPEAGREAQGNQENSQQLENKICESCTRWKAIQTAK